LRLDTNQIQIDERAPTTPVLSTNREHKSVRIAANDNKNWRTTTTQCKQGENRMLKEKTKPRLIMTLWVVQHK
jgi:hypothetical protein